MLRWLPLSALTVFLSTVYAQTPQSPTSPQTPAAQAEAPIEFEVATIKSWSPPSPQPGMRMGIRIGSRGGPGTNDPGQISWEGMTLKNLLTTAYNLKAYQVKGPDWLDTERFSIVAKVPAGATKEQVPIMLQKLLVERFQIKFHHEAPEVPVYELVVGKGGPKLKESPPVPDPPKDAPKSADAPPPPPPFPPKMGPDGCPVRPPGARGGSVFMMMPGRFRMCATQMRVDELANTLTNQLNRPVIDKTGLTAKYDFSLEFLPEGGGGMMPMINGMPGGGGGMVASASQAGPPPGGGPGGRMEDPNQEPAPPLAAALQSQLGLKLEAKRAPADMLVIDSMEKTPTEN